MKPLNSRRNRKSIFGRKRVVPKTQPSYNRSNKNQFRRQVKGSVRTFFWKIFSSFKFSFVIIIALISILGFGIYWIFKNQYFQIKNYEVIGSNLVSQELILSAVAESKGKWIFFISPPSLEKSILETSNFIKSTYIEKKLPDILKIHVEERNPVAVWRTVNGSYLIDDEGYVLDRSLNEDVTLEKVLQDIYIEPEMEIVSEEETSFQVEEDTPDEEKLKLEEILDPELLSQIEMDKKSRGNEQTLLDLNFDQYNTLPDSFKKYPQVKILSDDVYEINSTIDWNIWGGYSTLLSSLKERNGFSPKEILIFSETKVLVLLENDKQAYFRLDQDLANQVQILEFVYGRLMIDSVDFKEIDLRFKRPVIRN